MLPRCVPKLLGATARVTERLFVNILLGEYKVYKKGEWATRKFRALNEDPPDQTPNGERTECAAGSHGAARLPEDERKRKFESMSKAQLVKLACQAGLQPTAPQSPNRAGKRDNDGREGRAKKQRQAPKDAETSTSAGTSSPASPAGSADRVPAPDKHIIISMPGPELADLMLTKDGKILDNRSWGLSAKYLPSWVYPLVGARKKKKDWDWRDDDWTNATQELKDKVKAVPVKESVSNWYGHVPGRLG